MEILILPKCPFWLCFREIQFVKRKNSQNISGLSRARAETTRSLHYSAFMTRHKLAGPVPHIDFLQGTGQGFCHRWVTLLQ